MNKRTNYGHPLRVWDAGPDLADRYTILPPRSAAAAHRYRQICGLWNGLGASADPYLYGDGYRIAATPGPHLGVRVHWRDVPLPVRRFAVMMFPEYFIEVRE